MKKKLAFILTLITVTCSVATGCSLSKSDVNKADEYVNDNTQSESEQDTADFATASTSTIVVKNLFEPLLEEISASATTSTIEAAPDEASTEDSAEAEEVDKVNMVFFGDSQIANGRDDGTDIPTLIQKQVPHSVSYNLAIGGTTASVSKSTSSTTPEDMHDTGFVGMAYALAGTSDREETLADYPNILETMNKIDPKEVDYYFIEYGANDFFTETVLDKSIYDNDQVHSYYGALTQGINVLEKISPNAEFILVSPFYGIYKEPDGSFIGDSYVVSNGIGTLADYASKAKNVSEDKGIYFFDAMFISKCDLYLDTAEEYLMDGLHLSLTGRQIFARLLAHYPNFLEKNEPFAYLDTDFIKIKDFDPDEYYMYDEGEMKKYYPESYEKYIKGEFPLAQPKNN